MAADMAIRDNAGNRLILNVESWQWGFNRGVKQHDRKTVPTVGAKSARLTDYGSNTEIITLEVVWEGMTAFLAARTKIKTTFFANRPMYFEMFYDTVDEVEYEGAVLSHVTNNVSTNQAGENKIEATIVFMLGETFTLLGG